jgi:hypothetical protein
MDNYNKTQSSAELLAIDTLVKEECKSINKDNPFKLAKAKKDHFLPSINTVADFFGVKVDANTIYEKLNTNDAELPKISSSSLHEMGRKGVGKTVFKKFTHLLIKAKIPGMYDFLTGKDEWIKRATGVNSNAMGWLGAIGSFNAAVGQPDVDLELFASYRYLTDFITRRCHQQVEFIESLKRKKSANEIDPEDEVLIWEGESKPFLQKHTNISEGALDLISKELEKKTVIAELDLIQKKELIIQVFELEYNFLLNCLACYEVGYVAQYQAPTDCKWFISLTLEAYTGADNTKTCFRCLMDTLLSLLKDNDIQIDQRQLASCVPINFQNKENEIGEDPKSDAQYNKLYKWYRSTDLPSDKLLLEFFNNIAQLSQCEADYSLFDVAKMAIGFDKAFLEKSETVKKEFGSDIDFFTIWKLVLRRYPDYYRYHCQQHSLIKN